MAAYQKRLLNAENSRLGKVDIIAMLRKDEAWATLPRESREQLYSLLPPAAEKEPPRDPDVNPLNIQRLKPYIEEELRNWQNDLTEGREVKKWRVEAMQAGKDHTDGKFDEWKIIARDEYWGKPNTSKVEADDGKGGEKEKEEVNGPKHSQEVKDSDDGESDS